MIFHDNNCINLIDNKEYNLDRIPNELKVSTITVSFIVNCMIDYDNIFNINNKIINNETIIIEKNKKKNSFGVFIGKKRGNSRLANIKSNNIIQILGCKNFKEINNKLNKLLFILKNYNIIYEKLENIPITNLYYEYISLNFKMDYSFENSEYLNLYESIKKNYDFVKYDPIKCPVLKFISNGILIYIFKNGNIMMIICSNIQLNKLKSVFNSIKNFFNNKIQNNILI